MHVIGIHQKSEAVARYIGILVVPFGDRSRYFHPVNKKSKLRKLGPNSHTITLLWLRTYINNIRANWYRRMAEHADALNLLTIKSPYGPISSPYLAILWLQLPYCLALVHPAAAMSADEAVADVT